MAAPILVFGHKNPDNDAISAAVGYAYLKNELAKRAGSDAVYEACRLGGLPPETEWILGENGIEAPRLIESLSEGQQVILVDHNEALQSADGLDAAEIVEIVDHHRIADVMTANPIQFLNLPVGSTATIVTMEFRRHNVEMPPAIARVLLSAVMTDTVILKSPTATPTDHEQVAYLAGIAGVDPTEFGLAVFKCRGGEDDMPVDKLVGADAKEFQIGDATVLIAQHETVDLPAVMKREEEIREHMRRLRDDHGYEFVLLLVTDIVAEGSQFMCEGNRRIVNRVFGIHCTGEGGTWMPGILSRKKQVAAKILGA